MRGDFVKPMGFRIVSPSAFLLPTWGPLYTEQENEGGVLLRVHVQDWSQVPPLPLYPRAFNLLGIDPELD